MIVNKRYTHLAKTFLLGLVALVVMAAQPTSAKVIEVTSRPLRAVLDIGETYTLTTLVRTNAVGGTAISGEKVRLNILCGLHNGLSSDAFTNDNGIATFPVTSTVGGRDVVETCIDDNGDALQECGEIVSVTWQESVNPTVRLDLSPEMETRNLGATQELIAKLSSTTTGSAAVSGNDVTFKIRSGPHSTLNSVVVSTDSTGKARWSYTGTADQEGTDIVRACFDSNTKCDESTIEWQHAADVWLNPASATCNVGEPHQLRATVNRKKQGNIVPLVGTTVEFKVKSGPNAGMVLPQGTTDANGDAFATCTGNSTGTNEFEACIVDHGDRICSTSLAIWKASAVDGVDLLPRTATRNIGSSIDLTATVTSNGNLVAGQNVAFNILSGPNLALNGVMSTDSNGKALWSYKGIGEGTDMVRACSNSECDDSTIGWENAAQIYLNPASSTCKVGEPHELRATVKRLKDGRTVPLVGVLVDFKVLSGPNAGMVLPSATTNTNGDAFTMCTGNSTGTNEFEACVTDNGDIICTTSKNVWTGATGTNGIDLAVPSPATRNIGTAVDLIATVTSNGNPVTGQNVDFSILSGPHSTLSGVVVPTNPSGKATWSYTGTGEGIDTARACINNGNCDDAILEWQHAAKVWLNPAYKTCVVGEPHELRATVNRKKQGSTVPLVGKLVEFYVKSGPNAGMVLPSNTTNANGDAFSTCTGNSTGRNEFEACITDNGERICTTSQAVWGGTAPAPSIGPVENRIIDLLQSTATRNIGTSIDLIATATLNGSPVGGQAVAFNVLSGPHTGVEGLVATNSSGKARWSYTGTADEGNDSIEACWDSNCDDATVQWQFRAQIYLNPAVKSCVVGEPHDLRADVYRLKQGRTVPLVGTAVDFKVISGPNSGMVLPSDVTNTEGKAFSTCTGNSTGTNEFEACITDTAERICTTSKAVWGGAIPQKHYLRSMA